MAKSMTGFGRATSKEGSERIFTVEMKSVNHRYLDLNIRMPKSMISFEDKIRRCISKKINRGKIDIFINLKDYHKGDQVTRFNETLADSYYNSLLEIEKRYPVKNDISLSLIARFPEVITIEEKEQNLQELWVELEPLINEAVDVMVEMREVEGLKLKEDILVKCNEIKENVKIIEAASHKLVDNYKIKLEERIKELTSNMDIDPNRIATEIAIFADKSAVDEEITRLYSHLNQISSTFSLNEPIGRKMDFIIQELNREANTIASKSYDIDITNIVINIKNTIEKIREQIQNIE
ncbi:YicC/YloC family endoribonuclease [Clostridium paridis]|uniref:YicC family protein n=1 Tax=Clostridium paridis TaxID=2803863 RepID=A0A937FFA6_9CLOT|nr:YicC/YloC family endoribonuclease [Clostridium paridis]MBL4930817.1 YicC family protein [Clostridium paridis]